jgi:Uma2 family endonuclease
MTTLLNASETDAAEARTILRGVRWETYEQLLSNYEDSPNPRFTYDRGVLEITSPSSEHELIAQIITQLVYILAEEWDIEYQSFGSTTFKRRELESGFEPDACFYIQSLDLMGGVKRLDAAVNPPPDLAIEVDITKWMCCSSVLMAPPSWF